MVRVSVMARHKGKYAAKNSHRICYIPKATGEIEYGTHVAILVGCSSVSKFLQVEWIIGVDVAMGYRWRPAV